MTIKIFMHCLGNRFCSHNRNYWKQKSSDLSVHENVIDINSSHH